MASQKTNTVLTGAAVELRGLVKEYDGRRVLDVERLTVERGTVCAVTGPNGSGKTTLLSLLALLEPPTAGSIALFGEDAAGAAARRTLRRRVVMVGERPWMFHTTVLGNVVYGLSARGVAHHEAERRARAALESLGMVHASGWPARRLSAGEVRRVALARALVIEPELALLDEPLADIDAQNAAILERVIGELPGKGTTVLVATHRLETAYRLADRCVSLVNGRISEAPSDNHFAGRITEEDGEPVMQLAPGCVLRLSTDIRGHAHVAIDPRTVIISRDAPASSARNAFTGSIASLSAEGDRVRVTIDVGVPIVALITGRSLREMDLRLGERVGVLFKTVSREVHGGKPE